MKDMGCRCHPLYIQLHHLPSELRWTIVSSISQLKRDEIDDKHVGGLCVRDFPSDLRTEYRAPYCVGGGSLLLSSLLLLLCLHVAREQVLLQLQLGGADQGAERAAECLAALADVLAADVLLHLLLSAQHSRAEGTVHCWRCWAWRTDSYVNKWGAVVL